VIYPGVSEKEKKYIMRLGRKGRTKKPRGPYTSTRSTLKGEGDRSLDRVLNQRKGNLGEKIHIMGKFLGEKAANP